MALNAASRGDRPCSMWCSTASTTTIASSTTSPIASTRPKSDSVLMEKPSSGKITNVPTSDTGTARTGISVAREALQEDEDDDDDEDERLEERLDDLADALGDREGGVQRDHVIEVVGEARLRLLHQRLRRAHGVDRVRARQLVDRDDGGGSAVQASDRGVVLRAELDARHVAHAHDRAVDVGAHDDVAELLLVGQPALGSHRIGELLARRHRLAADLTGRIHGVLLLQRIEDLVHRDAELGQRVGVRPRSASRSCRRRRSVTWPMPGTRVIGSLMLMNA